GLVSLLAHELKSPITVMMGYAATFRGSLDQMSRDDMVAAADAMVRHTESLTAIVQSYADAGAVESGDLVLAADDTDVGEWVRQTIIDLAPLTKRHRVVVDVDDVVVFALDRLRVRQVLTNLISNAVKFSR